MNPAVSVIIPSYNALATLKKNLPPLLAWEKMGEIELLIVDDGSTDGTSDYLKAQKISYLKNKVNLGVAHARNLGAQAAQGKILFFIDADVLITVTEGRKLLEALLKNPSYKALGATPRLRPDWGENWSSAFVEVRAYWPCHQLNTTGIVPLSGLQSECCVIWKEFFQKLGGFNQRYKKSGMEEFDFGHRIQQVGEQNGLVLAAFYERECKKLGPRLKDIFRRSALYVPLFLRKKSLESSGSTGNRAEFVSLLFTIALLVSTVVCFLNPLSSPLFLLCLICQLLWEKSFLFFCLKHQGILFALFSYFALRLCEVSVLLGLGTGLIQQFSLEYLSEEHTFH